MTVDELDIPTFTTTEYRNKYGSIFKKDTDFYCYTCHIGWNSEARVREDRCPKCSKIWESRK